MTTILSNESKLFYLAMYHDKNEILQFLSKNPIINFNFRDNYLFKELFYKKRFEIIKLLFDYKKNKKIYNFNITISNSIIKPFIPRIYKKEYYESKNALTLCFKKNKNILNIHLSIIDNFLMEYDNNYALFKNVPYISCNKVILHYNKGGNHIL